MLIQLSPDTTEPLYQRIAQGIRDAIAKGHLLPGQKLPARITLARQLGVSMVTVRHAYELLQQEKLLESRHGSGTFVRLNINPSTSPSSRRLYDTITVLIGESTLANTTREMCHVVSGILEGVSEVFGPHEPRYRFAESLNEASLAHLTPRDAVLYKHARRCDVSMIASLHERNIPLLGVWGGVPLQIPTVDYDRLHAASLAPSYLLACGYRRLGYIGVKGWQLPLGAKFLGFASVLHDAGLDYLARHVQEVDIYPGHAYRATQAMLRSGEPPEALVVDTDFKAMEVITALADAGLRVPEDIAVVGYDDVPEVSMFMPNLTTVRTDKQDIGRAAGQLLSHWPATREQSSKVASVALKARLIERGSVLPLSSKSVLADADYSPHSNQ